MRSVGIAQAEAALSDVEMRGPWRSLADGHAARCVALAPRRRARLFAFHGYVEEGTTTTPFAMVVLKWE